MVISVAVDVVAPLAQVWLAYTEPEHIVQWNAASDDWHTTESRVDLREGGEFSSRMEAKDGSVGFDFAGVYTTVIPQELLQYRFGPRSCSVTFSPTTDGSRVEVQFDPEDTNPIDAQQAGWQAILDNFKRHVESLTTT